MNCREAEAATASDGSRFGTTVKMPRDVYSDVRGVALTPSRVLAISTRAPWVRLAPRASSQRERRGPGSSESRRTGVFAVAGLPSQATGEVAARNLVEIGPSIMRLSDIEPPADAAGRSLL